MIVDNDHTAAKLMSLLEKKKLGRVTFMPLNQLARRMSPRKDLGDKPVVAYLIEVNKICCTCHGRSRYAIHARCGGGARGAGVGFLGLAFLERGQVCQGTLVGEVHEGFSPAAIYFVRGFMCAPGGRGESVVLREKTSCFMLRRKCAFPNEGQGGRRLVRACPDRPTLGVVGL